LRLARARPRGAGWRARRRRAVRALGQAPHPGRPPPAGGQEAPGHRLRLRAEAGDHPARRADVGREHGGQDRDHGHAGGGVEADRALRHRPGRARHGHRVRVLGPDRGPAPGPRVGRRRAVDDPGRPARDGRRHRPPEHRAADARMLSVAGVDVFIQTSQILRNVSLAVGAREVVCLVGRNGSGKTTTLRTVMGYLRPRAGAVAFHGQAIHGRRTHEIARLGLGWAPEDSGIFSDLTVAENIEIATWTRPSGRPAADRIAQAYEVFPALRRYAARRGPEMSGGERKMLSIARALALDPEMLLL